MADRIAISSGVKSTSKGVSGNPGNPPKTAPALIRMQNIWGSSYKKN